MEIGDDFVGVVVGGVGVDDDAEVGSGLVEIGFPEIADFYGRVDEAVVIVRVEIEIW